MDLLWCFPCFFHEFDVLLCEVKGAFVLQVIFWFECLDFHLSVIFLDWANSDERNLLS